MGLFAGQKTLNYLSKMGVESPIIGYQGESYIKRSRNKIPLGIDEFGDPFFINLKQSKKILLISPTGGGKSFIIRGFADRAFMSGCKVCYMTDIKPEYYSSVRPAQTKFKKSWYLAGETKHEIPVKSYYPYFFTKMFNLSFRESETYQLSLTDLNKYDLLTILGIPEEDTTGEAILDIFGEETKFSQKTTVDDLKALVMKNKLITAQTKKNIIRKIGLVVNSGVIGDQFTGVDIINDMNEGYIPALNLYGFNKLGKYTAYPAAYVAYWLRTILSAKAEGRIKRKTKLLEIVDELLRFCPNTENPSSKREIMETADISRQYRISMILSTQFPWRIPPSIIQQCDIILISYKVDLQDIKEIVKQKVSRDYDVPIKFLMDIAETKGRMTKYRDGQRDWLLIDVNNQERMLFRPFAPLSYHLEEGET